MDEGKGPNPYFEGLHAGESDELRTLRLALWQKRTEFNGAPTSLWNLGAQRDAPRPHVKPPIESVREYAARRKATLQAIQNAKRHGWISPMLFSQPVPPITAQEVHSL